MLRGPSSGSIVLAALLLAVLVLAASVSSAGSGGLRVELVAPPSHSDDSNPPAPPPEKAAAAQRGEDHGPLSAQPGADPHPHQLTTPSDTATSDDAATAAPLMVDDPDIWVCLTEDGGGAAWIIHDPTPEIKEAARQWLIGMRSEYPTFMPVVEFPDHVPPGCEPAPGEPALEAWLADRSILSLLNPDGSIKHPEQP